MQLVDRARAGDPRATARLLSLVESASPQLREASAALMAHQGHSHVVGLTGAGLVPGVDLRLQFVALGQQRAVLRRQVVDDAGGTRPEGFGGDAGAGNGFVGDEVVKGFGDLQATDLNALSHCLPHLIANGLEPGLLAAM